MLKAHRTSFFIQDQSVESSSALGTSKVIIFCNLEEFKGIRQRHNCCSKVFQSKICHLIWRFFFLQKSLCTFFTFVVQQQLHKCRIFSHLFTLYTVSLFSPFLGAKFRVHSQVRLLLNCEASDFACYGLFSRDARCY